MGARVDILLIYTLEHPTFGTLRFMQQALSTAVPEAHMEIGKDTMDMHIRMPQGAGVHLLFTWVGSWESGEREGNHSSFIYSSYLLSSRFVCMTGVKLLFVDVLCWLCGTEHSWSDVMIWCDITCE